jgi:hypothetical protein
VVTAAALVAPGAARTLGPPPHRRRRRRTPPEDPGHAGPALAAPATCRSRPAGRRAPARRGQLRQRDPARAGPAAAAPAGDADREAGHARPASHPGGRVPGRVRRIQPVAGRRLQLEARVTVARPAVAAHGVASSRDRVLPRARPAATRQMPGRRGGPRRSRRCC